MRKSKVVELEEQIERLTELHIAPLEKEISEYRRKCKHKRAIKEYHADTGNWCKDDDSYWAIFYCPTCRTYWRADDNEEDYRQFTKVESIKKWRKENETE